MSDSSPSTDPTAPRERWGESGSAGARAPFVLVSIFLHALVIGALVWAWAAPRLASGEGARLQIRATTPPAPEDTHRDTWPEDAALPAPLPPLPDPAVLEAPHLPPRPEDPEDDLPPEALRIPGVEALPAPSLAAARALVRSRSPHERPEPAVVTPVADPRQPEAPRPAGPRSDPLVPVYHPTYYPLEARRRGLRGIARVEVLVSAEGAVVRTRLAASSGYALLDQAALTVAARWRFRPPGRLRRAVVPFRFAPD